MQPHRSDLAKSRPDVTNENDLIFSRSARQEKKKKPSHRSRRCPHKRHQLQEGVGKTPTAAARVAKRLTVSLTVLQIKTNNSKN